MNQERISNVIKKIRKENNLTQKDFAELFGVTYQAVSKWENGINIPDIAILKEISTRFNIDINELLGGKVPKKSHIKKYILVAVILLILVAILLGYIFTHDHDFTFKTLSTTCEDFKVLGSIAYNDNKASIYISSIDCLDIDSETYSDISCILYEQTDNTRTEISSSSYHGEPITLNEYLEDVEFNIDNYEATCKYYNENSLVIELKVLNADGKMITHEIPLVLNDNCANSTSS